MASAATTLMTVQAKDLEDLAGKFKNLSSREASKIVTDEFRAYGATFASVLKEEAPVKEGVTRDSIKFTIKNPNTPEVELQIKIGNSKRPEVVIRSLLFGSVPHDIKPKRPDGWLKFEVRGKTVFTKHVNHPGTARDPFLNIAIQRTDSDRRALRAKVGALMIEQISDER